ncbi:hypothetical protein RHMOL_Rhmol09G0147400 [Rhododendron molle]|uniref:Uncharacterized protein n=1 Tax=Rhododendron molle TaxID=49168 RepID=A0ACC0MEU4_RHOML|nr:hypothetical protein RHMOL_Rhmol09G0147400 [Rhododendron molle]
MLKSFPSISSPTQQNPKQTMGREDLAREALILLRNRLCNPRFVFSPFAHSPDSNYSKLKFIVSSSVTEASNNSVLLLGPRGCSKNAVLELVIEEVLKEYPDTISVIKLNGLLHSDDNCALKVHLDNLAYSFEIARQLCMEHQLLFSKMASFDDNTQFMISMLKECGLAHKTVIFVLDEFDLFAQLGGLVTVKLPFFKEIGALMDYYGSAFLLLDVTRFTCLALLRDADQLLEKRVRSRFSHRKLLFLPPSKEDLQGLLKHILELPTESSLPHDYVSEFNSSLLNILADERFKQLVDTLTTSDSTCSHLLKFLFSAVRHMNVETGLLSIDNFKAALASIQRQPKLECLNDCSILELYILVCMRRLEVKEQDSYNFNSVMKEYKTIHDSFQTSDYYSRNVCLRAFEHLLARELISFMDHRGHNQSIEFRPVKLLISYHELYQGLKSYRSCPAILQKLIDREG